MGASFNTFESEITYIKTLTQKTDATGFFIQELLRFYSLTGTMFNSKINLSTSCTVDERYLTHVLSRSLLEPFFINLYIFDDLSQMAIRYQEQKNTFSEQYRKLINDLQDPAWSNFMQKYGNQLQTVNPQSSKPSTLPDVKSLLGKLKNTQNNSLDYLYPLYRITSFDTHGRSLGTIFESVFGKQCNFPVLDIEVAIDFMCDGYLSILNELRNNKMI